MGPKLATKGDVTITDGIDIHTWKISHLGIEITYNAWDFAGQTVYYNTHQVDPVLELARHGHRLKLHPK